MTFSRRRAHSAPVRKVCGQRVLAAVLILSTCATIDERGQPQRAQETAQTTDLDLAQSLYAHSNLVSHALLGPRRLRNAP